MKNHLTYFFLCLLIICCFPAFSVGQDFEGIIYYEVSDMAKQGMDEMPYMIKGSKARMEFGSGQEKGAMLLLPEESKMVILIDAMQGYMTMDANQAQSDMGNYENTDAAETGETKTIAGKNCEIWQIKSEENTVEACMAKGMGTFMLPKSPMGQNNTPQWAKELMDQGAMPLEVIELKDGKQTMQMRATKIEEKSLPADLFVIPEGYNDMSGMMQQMQNRN